MRKRQVRRMLQSTPAEKQSLYSIPRKCSLKRKIADSYIGVIFQFVSTLRLIYIAARSTPRRIRQRIYVAPPHVFAQSAATGKTMAQFVPAVTWSTEHLRLAIQAARVALWSWDVDSNQFTRDHPGFEPWGQRPCSVGLGLMSAEPRLSTPSPLHSADPCEHKRSAL